MSEKTFRTPQITGKKKNETTISSPTYNFFFNENLIINHFVQAFRGMMEIVKILESKNENEGKLNHILLVQAELFI